MTGFALCNRYVSSKVLRDLMLKRDSRNLSIVDGKIWAESKYFIVGTPRQIQRRIYVLVSVEDNIDFRWYTSVVCPHDEEFKLCPHALSQVTSILPAGSG